MGQAGNQRGSEQREQPAADQVHRAPAEVRCNYAAGDAREEDAEEKGAQQRADRPAAGFSWRELGDERDDHLREAGAEADDESSGGRRLESRCARGREQGDYSRRMQRDDEPPLVELVAERHEENDAAEEAAEGERRDPADGRAVNAELGRHRAEHRRLIVDAARGHQGRGREEQHQAAVQRLLRDFLLRLKLRT
jgi:hypothetical protein